MGSPGEGEWRPEGCRGDRAVGEGRARPDGAKGLTGEMVRSLATPRASGARRLTRGCVVRGEGSAAKRTGQQGAPLRPRRRLFCAPCAVRARNWFCSPKPARIDLAMDGRNT